MGADSHIKTECKRLLESYGLAVDLVDENQNERTPDLRAIDSLGHRYLFEVKEKKDEETFSERRRRALSQGEIFEDSKTIAATNSLFGKLKDAAEQLGIGADVFKIVLYVCASERAKVDKETLLATLYGKRNLLSRQAGRPERLECYYFGESAFYTHRQGMDAAIILWLHSPSDIQWLLCLNDLSPKYPEFKKSRLYELFSPDGVIDPPIEERGDSVILFKDEFDRRDPESVLSRLRDARQDPSLDTFDMGYLSATIGL